MGKFLTQEQFIKKAKSAHGNKYDYSRANYKDAQTRVEIFCPEHGSFWQRPTVHINNKAGCPSCSGRKRLTLLDFIKRAKQIHGDKYDYSKVKLYNGRIKVEIICPEHGSFWMAPANHINANQGCSICGIEKTAQKNTLNLDDFIRRSRKAHGDKYDYSKVEYIGAKINVEIVCPRHGSFLQRPQEHWVGKGCQLCARETRANKARLTTDDFIERATAIHKGRYDYSVADYQGNEIKVEIICLKHGSFWQTPHDHLANHGCPICQSSRGEQVIARLLNKWGIHFIRQKRFDKCKDKKYLPFDFYFQIKDCLFLVEYDGHQHFLPRWKGEHELKRVQRRDAIKNAFAKKYGFILIRIPYTDYDYLEDILKQRIELHLGRPLLPASKQKRKHAKIKELKGHQLSLLK